VPICKAAEESAYRGCPNVPTPHCTTHHRYVGYESTTRYHPLCRYSCVPVKMLPAFDRKTGLDHGLCLPPQFFVRGIRTLYSQMALCFSDTPNLPRACPPFELSPSLRDGGPENGDHNSRRVTVRNPNWDKQLSGLVSCCMVIQPAQRARNARRVEAAEGRQGRWLLRISRTGEGSRKT
jgi:hypothetical protein